MVKRFMLISLVGIILSGFLYSRRGSAPSNTDVERAEPTPDANGVISVGSIRLWKDYEANEIAADNRYKGRTLRVTGRVLTVEKSPMETALINLVSGNPIFLVHATLTAAETPRAATLARGDTVIVQCKGAGTMMRMPQLENCTLLRPE